MGFSGAGFAARARFQRRQLLSFAFDLIVRMSKKVVIVVVALFAVGIAGLVILPTFIRARSTSSSNACLNNLRQIEAAVEQWAVENHKTTNDIPTWDAISPYLAGERVCPEGGTYTLGHVGEHPRCSIGGFHSVP